MNEPTQTPANLWTSLQRELQQEHDPTRPCSSQADLWQTLAAKLDPATYKPRRAPDVQVTHLPAANGDAHYILHNPTSMAYLEVDEQNFFLWELLDGEHTVADLAMAYLTRFGSLPFDRLSQLLAELKASDLLAEKPIDIFHIVALRLVEHSFAYRLQRFADTAFQKEFALKNADQIFTGLYRRGGQSLFTRPALILLAAVTVSGLACFVYLEPSEGFDLLSHNGLHGAGLLIVMLANLFVILCHESAHALTCKAYGRRVRKVGFMVYFGLPAFFVDATDIWMKGRFARIAVSLAGPCANLVVGGIIAIAVALLPTTPVTQAFFQAAYVAYLGALFNLNPLLELDGYYVLMDWLEIPQLRPKSFAFVKDQLLTKLRERSRFSREERIFTMYGLLAIAYTIFTVWLVVYIWENEAALMLRTILSGQDVLAMVLLGGLTLAAGTTLVLSLVARVVLLASAEGQRVRALVQDMRSRMTFSRRGNRWVQ